MNKIFTQIALGTALLFANAANAQLPQDFNGGLNPLKSNCWKFTNMSTIGISNGKLNPIEGDSSIKQTSPGDMGELSTPFYDLTSDLNVSFSYKLSSKLSNGATRRIEIGLTDRNNTFSPIGSAIVLDDKSAFQRDNDPAVIINRTIKVSGTNRITVRISSLNGDGNSVLYIDALNITHVDPTITTMPLHYLSSCNSAPVATNDVYSTAGYASQFYSRSVLQNDTDGDINIDGALTATIATPSPDGNVIMASDGTFTFKPNEGFAGTSTSFTYRVSDNGYEPISTTATVIINFTEEIPVVILPIHFASFVGNANGNKAQLTWSVADNETGSHFEVEKSTDGKKYQSVATVMTSTTVGTEKYDFTDVAFATSGSFYRIKVINKDNSTSYSKTVYIKGATTVDNKLTLMQNPVQSTLNFSFTSATDETAEVAIYNLAGVKMHSQKVAARKGTNSISLGMDSKFNKGAYILTVQSAAASRSVQLIKQ